MTNLATIFVAVVAVSCVNAGTSGETGQKARGLLFALDNNPMADSDTALLRDKRQCNGAICTNYRDGNGIVGGGPGNGNYPQGNGNYPQGNGNYPQGTGNYPQGNGNDPPGTGNGNYPPAVCRGSLCIDRGFGYGNIGR